MARKLTDKQAAFVREYSQDFNATAAAERAGLSGDYGRQLLTKSHVKQAIDNLTTEARTEAVMSLREVQEWWSNLIRGPHDVRDQLKAATDLSRSLGGFTDRIEHTFKRDPRELTDEELEEALANAGLTE